MSDQNQPPNPQYPGAGGPQNPQNPNRGGQYGGQPPSQGQYGRPPGQGPYGGPPPGPGQGPQGPGGPGRPMPPQGGMGAQGNQQGQPSYGQPGASSYGQPGQQSYGQGGQAAYEQLQVGGPAGQWQPEAKKKRGKLIPLAAAVVMALVIGSGAVFAYGKLNNGKQPDEVLPGTAVAYARIDLNPSAGQKVAAVRFMLKLPSVKDKLGLSNENDDLRQKLFEQIKKQAGDDLADVDYDKDVKPWLGDRAGFAAVPSGDGKDKPTAVMAVQVKDEDAAAKGMDKLLANEKKKPGRVFSNGYLVLADDQAAADSAVAAAKDNPLAKNAKYTADMDALGEQGVASFWADTKGIAALGGKFSSRQPGVPEGSMAAALRFDAQYVELKGIARSDQSIKVSKSDAGELVSQLPDGTTGALALSDGENLVGTMWEQLKKSGVDVDEVTEEFAEETGLSLPDDLKTVLGKNVAVAIDKDGSDGPKIAARIETDPAKAAPVVQKLTDLLRSKASANIPIRTAKDDDTLVVATNEEYAEQVLKGGNLGQTESFKQALPDTSGAVMVGYVDFEAAGSLVGRRMTENKDVAALRSGGYVVRTTGDNQAEFSLRVVAK